MIKIKPIKTEYDYKNALNTIDKLWDAKANTEKGDYLEVLTTLVEKYEEEHYDISAPDPIGLRLGNVRKWQNDVFCNIKKRTLYTSNV